MRKESDTSRARKFILENKDKYDFKEMTKKVLEMTTKLNERSVKTLIGRTLDKSLENFIPPAGKQSLKAQEYISDNINKKTEKEIIDYITQNIFLSEFTAMKLYELIKLEKDLELREKQKEKDCLMRYKGRKRQFFYIDDSKLYRGVKNGQIR